MPLFPEGAGPAPAPVSLLSSQRPRRALAAILVLAAWAALPVLAAPGGKPRRPQAGFPWVVVDYSARSGSYRVVGDVTLLSRRLSPGTTFDLVVAAAALGAGDLTETTELLCRTPDDAARSAPLTVARALQESNDDFFSQVLKKMGYEPVRKFLVAARYTPGVPEAVSSFADLARGEPLRVTVFEQNLFVQALVRRELPLGEAESATLERWLALKGRKGAWGKEGTGEVSSDPPLHVSWFNGAVRLRDGLHVITVAALSPGGDASARERLLGYLSSPRR